jgi:hypothetical protein
MKRRWVLGFLVVVLAILHQDFWFWSDRRLVFDFIPVGLAYHAMYSIAAACLWAAAVRFAWPHGIEAWADESHEADDDGPSEVTS